VSIKRLTVSTETKKKEEKTFFFGGGKQGREKKSARGGYARHKDLKKENLNPRRRTERCVTVGVARNQAGSQRNREAFAPKTVLSDRVQEGGGVPFGTTVSRWTSVGEGDGKKATPLKVVT